MSRLLSLPRDLLLHLLLNHFTLQEVIQIRCLCHELYDLVHYCLSRRRSLKLFFSFPEVQAYSQVLYEHNLESDPALRLHSHGPSSDELILDQHRFLNPLVDLLVDGLFPNVTHLIIYFDYYYTSSNKSDDYALAYPEFMQHNVVHMLSRMRTRLSGLSLFGKNRGDHIGEVISRSLLREINQMPNLRRLDLCVMFLFLFSIYDTYLDRDEIAQHNPTMQFLVLEPKVLAKLEQISVLFDAEKNGSHFCEHSFRHLGPHLTQLAMHQLLTGQSYYVAESSLRHLLIGGTSSLVTSTITHLKLTQHLSKLLPKMLPRFTRLKSLDLVNSTPSKEERAMSMLELFGLLAQFCPQLTELKLSKFKLGWIEEAEALKDVAQLGGITDLVLNVHAYEIYFYGLKIEPAEREIPLDSVLIAFAYIFPNLERFNLKTTPGYFRLLEDYRSILANGMHPQLRMLSIGCYTGREFTAHQLLSAQYRKRYIRECGEGWTELEKQLELYCKDLDGVWSKEKY